VKTPILSNQLFIKPYRIVAYVKISVLSKYFEKCLNFSFFLFSFAKEINRAQATLLKITETKF